ncbi:MAG: MotA/TolQ/ExbB proton channel family protein [Deltaproteobacteria bacterium]|nr:MotA/TolQ/ExbB proton channel family protein [Deltaproteobacteria bacterium]
MSDETAQVTGLIESITGSGGVVVAVIGLGSVVALAVFLARLWALRRDRVLPRKLPIQVRDLVLREQVADAMTTCRTDESPLARVMLAGLRQSGRRREVVKEVVQEVGRHEAQLLHRGLGILELIAVVSPLLGLLGTVWGMIDVFRAIEVHGVGNAGALAGGIGTALYTTFAGLLVAIPVRIGHSWVLGKVDLLVMDMEEQALELVDLIADTEQPSASLAAGPGAVDADADADAKRD